MRKLTIRLFTLMAMLMALALPASHAAAQSGISFSPVITVNGKGITGYEIDQRMRFMALLNQSGDLREAAETALIEDRLRVWAAEQIGLEISAEGVAQGMAEFAGRADLSTEEFLKAIAQNGVEPNTFRDFVAAGVLWREVVKARFAPHVSISAADVDRALLLESQRGQGTRVLISEAIIPAPPGREGAAMAAARRLSAAQGEGAFGALARQYSASQSAGRGGRLEWLPLENLPPALRGAILALRPGTATQPIELQGALAVFMLRAIEDGGTPGDRPQMLSYMEFTLGATGSDEAAKLTARAASEAKRCNDLYGLAKGLAPDRLLVSEDQPQGAVPRDTALALAHLDPGETGTLQRGATSVLVMLCARKPVIETAPGEEGVGEPDRDALAQKLNNDALAAYAQGYLEDLRADAVITRPCMRPIPPLPPPPPSRAPSRHRPPVRWCSVAAIPRASARNWPCAHGKSWAHGSPLSGSATPPICRAARNCANSTGSVRR